MSGLQKHTVCSVAEYVDLISDIVGKEENPFWFRGHTSANYRSVPSVLRDSIPDYDARGNKIKENEVRISNGNTVTGISFEEMLDEFKRRAIGFID